MRKFLFLVFLIYATNLAATTYYISPTGSDSNSGTSPSTAWATFSHADSVVRPGDTVIVLNGTYVQAFSLYHGGAAGSPITYQAQNKWRAVIAPTSAQVDAQQASGSGVIVWVRSSYITMDGFELVGPSDGTAGHGYILYGTSSTGMDATNITITHNKIHHIGTSTTTCVWGGGITSFAAHSVIDSNYIYDTGSPLASCPGGLDQGMYIDDGNGQVITNNILVNLPNDGIWIQSNGSYDATFPSNLTVSNNTFVNIVNNGAIMMRCNVTGPCDNNKITNNIIDTVATVMNSGNTIYQTCGGGGKWGANNTYDHNLIFNSSSPSMCTNSVTNTVTSDPKFVNNTGNQTGDYHLQSRSSAIAAATSTGAPNHDFDGNPRPSSDGLYDIGAYECVVAKPNPPTNLTAVVH